MSDASAVARLFVALIHHPVLDRRGKTITSAITSLDLHDIARSSRTYGADAVFVVHPVAEQREFASRVIEHWRLGYGREFDSRRREALDLLKIVPSLDEAMAIIEGSAAQRPKLVYTSARAENGIGFAELRTNLEGSASPPLLLMLGTGFGLAPPIKDRADLILAPIRGAGDYNHLSVRAAAAIILDRLRGDHRPS